MAGDGGEKAETANIKENVNFGCGTGERLAGTAPTGVKHLAAQLEIVIVRAWKRRMGFLPAARGSFGGADEFW